VRGGLWEVDLLLRLMSPCYWPEVLAPCRESWQTTWHSALSAVAPSLG
jgi:hypothetical protein